MNLPGKHGASLLAWLAVLVCAAGCSVIAHGTTQRIAVTSDPAGARVSIDGSDYGDTPFTAVLDRKTHPHQHLPVQTRRETGDDLSTSLRW